MKLLANCTMDLTIKVDDDGRTVVSVVPGQEFDLPEGDRARELLAKGYASIPEPPAPGPVIPNDKKKKPRPLDV